MKIQYSLILIASLSILIQACGSETTTEVTTPETKKDTAVAIEEVISPVDSYAADWETFKQAVLNKDIPGMSAFASSDAIDSESLLASMSEDYILEALENTAYEDLTMNEAEGVMTVIFEVSIEGTDDEGATVGSGITLYFSQDAGRLLLDTYIVGG